VCVCVCVCVREEQSLTLRLDQVKIVLGAVDDARGSIRRAVHGLLRCAHAATCLSARRQRPHTPYPLCFSVYVRVCVCAPSGLRVAGVDCLRFVLPVLLRNLDRYPQDRPTIARALAALGAAHPDHAGTHTGLCGCERVSIPRSRHAGAAYYVEELLGLLHDTDQPEGSVDDPRCRSIGASGHSASRHTRTTEPGACVVCVCVCVCVLGGVGGGC
jgi:hypothetical protein